MINLEKTKEIVQEFFSKTGFEIIIEEIQQKEQTIFIKTEAEDFKILIGEGGETLSEIQKILKLILRKKMESPLYVDLDINNYKKRKIEYLKETAQFLANEVALSKKEKTLAPMPAYQRRIIHLTLAERKNVVTESIGQEPERRIVIKPYP